MSTGAVGFGLEGIGRGDRVGVAAFKADSVELRVFAFEMAAFSTCVRVGLMPHARHGGNGVCAVAVVGSKLEGTGLEKLQMTHTQVAAVTGGNSGCWDRGLFTRLPSDELGVDVFIRFGGFGTRVTFAEDLRKPAYRRKYC